MEEIIPKSREHRIKSIITVAGEGGAQAELSTIQGVLVLTITDRQSYHHCRASPQPSAPVLGQWVMERDEASPWCSSGWWGS